MKRIWGRVAGFVVFNCSAGGLVYAFWLSPAASSIAIGGFCGVSLGIVIVAACAPWEG